MSDLNISSADATYVDWTVEAAAREAAAKAASAHLVRVAMAPIIGVILISNLITAAIGTVIYLLAH